MVQSHYMHTTAIAANNRIKDGDGSYMETLTNELRVVVYYEFPNAEQREEIKIYSISEDKLNKKNK